MIIERGVLPPCQNHGLEMGFGLLRLSPFQKSHPEVALSLDVLGVEAERLLIFRRRLLVPLVAIQAPAR